MRSTSRSLNRSTLSYFSLIFANGIFSITFKKGLETFELGFWQYFFKFNEKLDSLW
jgi:hypothetical protein